MSPDTSLPEPITDDDLHTLVDGRLDAAAAAALEARVAADAQAAATLAMWRRQREALRGLRRELLQEPPPSTLLAAAQRADARRARGYEWQRLGGIAASVLLAFGLGWFGRDWIGGGYSGSAPIASAAPASAAQRFAQQAVAAHAVYQPEVRHPVEVPAAQQEHLVQWLSKRLGRPLQVPDLAPEGFELVGGRLLPGEGEASAGAARAQFMFQNAAGLRVTLYLGAVKPDSTAATETSFRFVAEGELSGFYWVDRGFGYALSGMLPREALLALATAVHRQL